MRYLLIIIIFLSSLHGAYGQTHRKYVREGNREYSKGSYDKSEIEYRRALDINPESDKAIFNLGDALYKLEKFEEADKEFARYSEIRSEGEGAAASAYNSGNSLLKAGKLEESIESYKKSLLADPSNHQAKYNLAYAQDMLQKQKEQEQQNKDQQDQQDKKDNGEQKEQDKQDQQNGDDNKDQEQQKKDGDNQQEQQPQEQQQQGEPENKMTREDAERLLQALANEEKDVQDKVKKQKAAAQRVRTLKNW